MLIPLCKHMTQYPEKSMKFNEWLILLACSLLWGGSFFFIEIALRGLPPFSLVFLRVGIGALVLLIASRLLNFKLQIPRPLIGAFLILGLVNNAIPFTLITFGQTHISSGLASILNATMPIWTVIIAHFWTVDEKLTINRSIGIVLGVIGVAVMIGYDALGNIGDSLIGQISILAATLSYGIAAIYARRFKAWGLPPMTIATGQLCASALILLPMTLAIDQPWTLPWPSLDVWAAVFGIATLSTSLTYFLYFKLLETAGATNVSLVTLLVPVNAILLGIFVLDETLEISHILGMAIIALGLLAIDGKLRLPKTPKLP